MLARLRATPHLESLGYPAAGGATPEGWCSNTTRDDFERRGERARASTWKIKRLELAQQLKTALETGRARAR